MLEPNAIVLYVDNLARSSKFYQELLGKHPEEASPSFNSFTLSNGMGIGLKAKHALESIPVKNGSGELAFTVDNRKKVDELFSEWQKKGINITQPPTTITYGYTFLAVDPDGNQLRVVSLGKS